MIARLKLVEPCNENRQVAADQVIDARIMPIRQPNADLRSREYLTPAEIEKLIKAAKDGRWGQRDACLIIVAYRHGLRQETDLRSMSVARQLQLSVAATRLR